MTTRRKDKGMPGNGGRFAPEQRGHQDVQLDDDQPAVCVCGHSYSKHSSDDLACTGGADGRCDCPGFTTPVWEAQGWQINSGKKSVSIRWREQGELTYGSCGYEHDGQSPRANVAAVAGSISSDSGMMSIHGHLDEDGMWRFGINPPPTMSLEYASNVRRAVADVLRQAQLANGQLEGAAEIGKQLFGWADVKHPDLIPDDVGPGRYAEVIRAGTTYGGELCVFGEPYRPGRQMTALQARQYLMALDAAIAKIDSFLAS